MKEDDMSHFWVKIWTLVAILLFLIVLILQNAGSVGVTLLFWSFQLPLIVVMLLFMLMGFIVGILVTALANMKKEPKK